MGHPPLPRVRASIVVLLTLAWTALAACASRGGPDPATLLARADALAAAGCHRCLSDALALLLAIPPTRAALRPAVEDRTLRVSLLLAMREKELGIDPRPHLDRARALASRLPAPAAAREQLHWVERLPMHPGAIGREAAIEERQRLAADLGAVRARVQRSLLPAAAGPAAPDALDLYIDLSLVCSGIDPRLPPAEGLAARLPASPLLEWRLGSCARLFEPRLVALAAADPRFVETSYGLGRYRLAEAGSAPARREARRLLAAAHEAFPQSPAITMELAAVVQISSYREALPLYESVTAAVPDHHDAWFGVTVCLSYLRRHADAVAAASRLIDLGRWRTGDARYWRAWNRHQLREHEAAWADVSEAKKTVYTTDVFGLSGIIAYDRGQLEVARGELEKAIELSDANCAAAWYLGLTHSGRERWPDSGGAFEHAERCYLRDVSLARAQKAAAEASETDAETRAAQIADAEATIREGEAQAALAAYNAAFSLVRAGEPSRARPFLDRALAHPAVEPRARELVEYLARR
jgi:tetratricopeptide (TPR) repeat protein